MEQKTLSLPWCWWREFNQRTDSLVSFFYSGNLGASSPSQTHFGLFLPCTVKPPSFSGGYCYPFYGYILGQKKMLSSQFCYLRRLVFDQSSKVHPVSESRGSPERDIHSRSSSSSRTVLPCAKQIHPIQRFKTNAILFKLKYKMRKDKYHSVQL